MYPHILNCQSLTHPHPEVSPCSPSTSTPFKFSQVSFPFFLSFSSPSLLFFSFSRTLFSSCLFLVALVFTSRCLFFLQNLPSSTTTFISASLMVIYHFLLLCCCYPSKFPISPAGLCTPGGHGSHSSLFHVSQHPQQVQSCR